MGCRFLSISAHDESVISISYAPWPAIPGLPIFMPVSWNRWSNWDRRKQYCQSSSSNTFTLSLVSSTLEYVTEQDRIMCIVSYDLYKILQMMRYNKKKTKNKIFVLNCSLPFYSKF